MPLEVAEVISTKKTFKKSTDTLGEDLALASVKVRMGTSTGGPRVERFAQPLFNFMHIPCEGEHVLITKAPSVMANPGAPADKYYYVTPIPIHGNKHLNPLPKSFEIDKSGKDSSYAASSGPQAPPPGKPYKPGENFKEVATVKNLQPYEGDILIEGRHGQGIRLSTGIGGSISQYKNSPFWKGDQGTPITVLSNGHKPKGGPNDFVIENPDDTNSVIILSSAQKINLTPSQENLGKGRKLPTATDTSQVIISSDRLHFNANIEDIILSSKKDITTATPNWAIELDLFYTNYLDFMKEVIKYCNEMEIHAKDNADHAQASSISIHMTGIGPTSPPTNAGTFSEHKSNSTTTSSNVKSIKTKIEQLQKDLEAMKQ